MKDQMTKKEHYVPKSYLKSFVNSDNKLCVFDRVKETNFYSYYNDICYEKYLYETPWEKPNIQSGKFILPNQIEDTLSKYERKYISTIKKIVKVCENKLDENAPICNHEDEKILASFIANMLLRNKWTLNQEKESFKKSSLAQDEFYQLAKQAFNDLTLNFGDEKRLVDIGDDKIWLDSDQLFDRLLNNINSCGSKSLINAARKKALIDEEINGSPAEQLMNDVLKLSFRILVSDTWQFITSSFPVLFELFDSEDGITHPKNIYVPIHPRFALLYSDEVRDRKYHNKKSIITKDEVRKLNHLYFETDIDQTRYIIAQEKFAIDDALNNDQNK